jgi:hypothetical protein
MYCILKVDSLLWSRYHQCHQSYPHSTITTITTITETRQKFSANQTQVSMLFSSDHQILDVNSLARETEMTGPVWENAKRLEKSPENYKHKRFI